MVFRGARHRHGAVHDVRTEGDDHEGIEEQLEVARPRRQHALHLLRHLSRRGVELSLEQTRGSTLWFYCITTCMGLGVHIAEDCEFSVFGSTSPARV